MKKLFYGLLVTVIMIINGSDANAENYLTGLIYAESSGIPMSYSQFAYDIDADGKDELHTLIKQGGIEGAHDPGKLAVYKYINNKMLSIFIAQELLETKDVRNFSDLNYTFLKPRLTLNSTNNEIWSWSYNATHPNKPNGVNKICMYKIENHQIREYKEYSADNISQGKVMPEYIFGDLDGDSINEIAAVVNEADPADIAIAKNNALDSYYISILKNDSGVWKEITNSKNIVQGYFDSINLIDLNNDNRDEIIIHKLDVDDMQGSGTLFVMKYQEGQIVKTDSFDTICFGVTTGWIKDKAVILYKYYDADSDSGNETIYISELKNGKLCKLVEFPGYSVEEEFSYGQKLYSYFPFNSYILGHFTGQNDAEIILSNDRTINMYYLNENK